MISVSGPNKEEYDREVEALLAKFAAEIKTILVPSASARDDGRGDS